MGIIHNNGWGVIFTIIGRGIIHAVGEICFNVLKKGAKKGAKKTKKTGSINPESSGVLAPI